jgi:hypothetical protein
MNMNADSQLIERSLAGDTEAFGGLVRQYQNLVCALTFSMCGNAISQRRAGAGDIRRRPGRTSRSSALSFNSKAIHGSPFITAIPMVDEFNRSPLHWTAMGGGTSRRGISAVILAVSHAKELVMPTNRKDYASRTRTVPQTTGRPASPN